ncbi:MAG: TlpA family protein disulfide reductase [Bacteroidales bacterium]|nr:TlpA family protein disulfide reductase [Bacteroidales bacterium]
MRKLIIFGVILALAACSTDNSKKESLLSGTVLNSNEGFVLLSMAGKTDTIPLNEAGSFSHTFLMEDASKAILSTERKYVITWMEPGSTLNVSFDVSDPEATRSLTGDTQAESEYSNKIDKVSRELNQSVRETYKLEPEAFRASILADRQKKEDMLNNLISGNPDISQRFIEDEKTAYEFSYYSLLISYEQAHKYYAGVDTVDLPADWYSFMNDVDVNNEAYLDIPESANVISSIINKKINESSELGDDAWGTEALLEEQFNWIEANITNPVVADHFMNSFISGILDFNGPAGIEEYIDRYYQISVNEDKKTALASAVAEWEPIMPGMDAPVFNLPDLEGNMVSLKDFAGKYVYIDFWATWCGPCKIEIPVLGQLATDYADKNIEIISISVDRDKQAWIDMVTEDKPNWMQLHDGVNLNDEYLVKFIPTFVLIDRNGKILDPRAPRPSSGEELTNLFNSLEGI